MTLDPIRRLSHRPTIRARNYVACSGNYLATTAAVRILEAGGNATDAGVAAGMCINTVMPDLTSFAGVAPIVAYDKAGDRLRTISGLGYWSKDLTLEKYRERFHGTIPLGAARAVVPGAPHAWLTALIEFGTISFKEAVAPALELCERGFPVYASLNRNILRGLDQIEQWPSSAAIFLRNGHALEIGSIFRQPDLAATFRRMIDAEDRATGTREDRIRAARDEFYQGEIAAKIAAFVSGAGGFMTERDLAEFSVELETPTHTSYRDVDVYTCGPWCQGPVLGQALNILEGFPIRDMEHNSADYLHVLTQSLNLAFADRHAYYGDPRFVDVPMAELMSKEYAARQRARISLDKAFAEMPAGGLTAGDRVEAEPRRPRGPEPDTSYVCVVDREGNCFSATPSDGMLTAPIVPGMGVICSARGYQSWLEPDHPSRIEGGKRPRLTPSPAMAFHDGELLMPFGTPGLDMQPQAMAQVFMNIVDFGMEVQEAIERPRAATYNFPGSGWPHHYTPAALGMEGRISRAIGDELGRRGHQVEYWPDWSRQAGNVCAIVVDQENGGLNGGADFRAESYAVGW
ncbi:gamma-glutamyltransferase family protein [Nonomuraea sp. K274]|uniref:Gamma-glutamyltransferase family protein n=1 Tax=Nonomuraea cypriaca TaxID=1187855 RepID=A0A931A7G1_9ACTN|nr:gamma-glutamyltransferase family protein [Nonomuraea cypriaca]MBF8184217.1 gamma-glutamyltransferase family protein [Nonomuraea cypriaca]